MSFAGVDYDTKRIDVVLVDDDGRPLEHRRYQLTGPFLEGEDAFERARHIRDVLPARSSWADEGVELVAIEQPYSDTFRASAGLQRVQGGIVACLPSPHDRTVTVVRFTPAEWRRANGLPAGGKRNAVKAATRTYAIARGCPESWPQDAFDAYCVALAGLQMTYPVDEQLELEGRT
jgi:hypothetical protein